MCLGIQGQCGGGGVLQCEAISLLPSLQTLAVSTVRPTGHHAAVSARYIAITSHYARETV